jgi:Flp pilus assembly protein TadG
VASVRVRPRGDRGSAAVEFALVLPLLLLLVFGIVDFGRMLNDKIMLTEAAREGARSAALQDETAGRARAKQLTVEIGAIPDSDIVVNDCADDDADQADTTITYNFKFVTPIGFMAGFMSGSGGTVPLQAKSVMPCLH